MLSKAVDGALCNGNEPSGTDELIGDLSRILPLREITSKEEIFAQPGHHFPFFKLYSFFFSFGGLGSASMILNININFYNAAVVLKALVCI